MTKLWSISPDEHFEENNVVQNKNSLVFKFWGKKRSDIAEIILASLNKLHVKSPRNCFSSHFRMFDYPFCQFPTFSRGFLESLLKLLSSSAKDRFDRRKVLSNKEEFFQRVLPKSFGFWAKKNYISGKQNQQECQTSVQLAQKNNLRKTMLKRKTFLYLFQTLIEKHWEVAQKNLVTFSKLKLTYPRE